ncbi:SDR family NAD(P)-dependent oxidoreductase [Thiohalorhabdus sp.]|uniref:SDR family NAD(P)-dependent oxidoreductase n=1 Tax=Thiohalorhabdus sp. TaxID=3094134 RepID=UPI002FC36B98
MHHALITGASGALARGLAAHLHQAGWQLTLATRDAQCLTDIPEAWQARVVEADVSASDGAEAAMAAASATSPPDGLAHCAGSRLVKPLHGTSTDAYADCMAANLDSTFYTLKAWASRLRKTGTGGSAVLVSSTLAGRGVANREAISAAKAGIEGLMRSAASTYARSGLRINAVAPGLLRGPGTEDLFRHADAEDQISAEYPLGRYGQPGDVAAAMAWLLSAEAGWITGEVLNVDGGFARLQPAPARR